MALRPWRLPDDFATLENASSDLRISTSTSLPANLTEAEADDWMQRQHRRVMRAAACRWPSPPTAINPSAWRVYTGWSGTGAWAALVSGWHLWSGARASLNEASKLLVDWAWTVLDLSRVEARIVPDNLSSIRVAEEAGLVREGLHPARYHKGGVWFDLVTYGAVNPLRPVPRGTWTAFELEHGDSSSRA